MDIISQLLKRKPKKVFGYVIVNAHGAGLAENMGWGGCFNPDQPKGYFVHPASSLPKIRQLSSTFNSLPVGAYPAIFEPQSGETKVTGGPYDFWQMAIWKGPPGSPIGPAPEHRLRSDFPVNLPVWFWSGSSAGWKKGRVVSLTNDNRIYVACEQKVFYFYLTQSELWPRDDSQFE